MHERAHTRMHERAHTHTRTRERTVMYKARTCMYIFPFGDFSSLSQYETNTPFILHVQKKQKKPYKHDRVTFLVACAQQRTHFVHRFCGLPSFHSLLKFDTKKNPTRISAVSGHQLTGVRISWHRWGLICSTRSWAGCNWSKALKKQDVLNMYEPHVFFISRRIAFTVH